MLALGTDDGKFFAIDVSTGDKKWPISHPIPRYCCHLNLFILMVIFYVFFLSSFKPLLYH